MKIIITEEQNEKLNRKIRLAVEKLGLEQSLDMFGNNVIKQAYIDNPLSFLEQFNNLKPVEEGGRIFYVDNYNLPLVYYTKEGQVSKKGLYWINYYRIWSFFKDIIGYGYNEIQEIMKEWLGTTYNLKRPTPGFKNPKFDGVNWDQPRF